MRLDQEIDPWLDVLDELPVAVTIVEAPAGPFVWHNKAAIQILGLDSVSSTSQPPPQHGALHADGRAYELHEYPLWRLLLEGAVVNREPMLYRRTDGRLLRLEVSASRVQPQGRQLGICTFQDVSAEYEARRDLTEAAERVELALHAGAIVGTWIWNIPEDLITADEQFAQSFGLDPARCRLGMSSKETLASVHPDDLAGVEAAVADAIARGGPYRHRYRVRQVDGLYHWVEASGRAELDPERRPARFPGVLLDIEASKQAEETRDLLMREVDHRARNALAMVQSIVRLTDAADPARFREEVIGRVDAMARAQGTLSRSNWEGGVLADLIREELSTYAPEQRFVLTGPHLSLPADQVQPFSMIMHEMATNAVKHGALSTAAGKVEVSWRSDPGRKIELAWRERGGPSVERPSRTGFGSRLIERLTRQLGGALDLDWRADGLLVRLVWIP